MIRSVMFDFGGVITTSPFEAFARFEREQGLPRISSGGSTPRTPTPMPGPSWNAVRSTSTCSANASRPKPSPLGHRLDARAVMAGLSGELRPAMVDAVRICSVRFRTACLTNNFAPVATTGRPDLAGVLSLFHAVLESSTLGVRKPDPRFYQMACDALEVEPHEVATSTTWGSTSSRSAADGDAERSRWCPPTARALGPLGADRPPAGPAPILQVAVIRGRGRLVILRPCSLSFDHADSQRLVLDSHPGAARQHPGILGRRTSTIGDAGGNIVGVAREVSGGRITRDVTVLCTDAAHASHICARVAELPGVRVIVATRPHLRDARRRQDRGEARSARSATATTCRWPTPRVWRGCAATKRPTRGGHDLTIKKNTVAIVTDGTAVLGLGDIGPEAALPVMEGKALLFKKFAGVDAFPICLDVRSTPRRRTHRRHRPHRRADGPGVRRDQPRGHRRPEVLRGRGAAEGDPRHPGLPRRPARDRGRRAGRP